MGTWEKVEYLYIWDPKMRKVIKNDGITMFRYTSIMTENISKWTKISIYRSKKNYKSKQ